MEEYKSKEKQNYYGYVYLTLDQKHNKIYVGQKKGKVEDSKNYFGSGLIIRRIINSRGNYFLKKIILGVCDNREKLLECETECKYFFNTFDKKYGYNIAINDLGGDTVSNHPDNLLLREKNRLSHLGKKQSKESNEKMSKAQIGKKKSEETKNNMSIASKGKKKKIPTWNKGLTKETDERIKKMSENNIGLVNPNKGKTYEEIYGEKRANELKDILRNIDHSGENNPRYRAKVTEDTKQKISKSLKEKNKNIKNNNIIFTFYFLKNLIDIIVKENEI